MSTQHPGIFCAPIVAMHIALYVPWIIILVLGSNIRVGTFNKTSAEKKFKDNYGLKMHMQVHEEKSETCPELEKKMQKYYPIPVQWVMTMFKLHILKKLLKSSSLALAYLTQDKK